jgi:hypothetical protein
MTARTQNRESKQQFSRRRIFIDAAASALCAPAIVQCTSLMPGRGVLLPLERPLSTGIQHAGFCERLFFHSLEIDLRQGRMTTIRNGRLIPDVEARRIVTHAQARGWLA